MLVDRGLGPDEGRGLGVVSGDEVIDVLPELGEGGEGGSAQRFAGEDGEPDLDLVEPGSPGRGEVEADVGVSGKQASFFLWVLRLSRTAWISLSG